MGKGYGGKVIRAVAGLVMCSFGTYLSIQAGIGLAPWDAFGIGVSNISGCSYGTVVVVTGCIVLLMDVLMKEKIGVGTLLDIAIVGKSIDFFTWMELMSDQHGLLGGSAMMIVSQFVLAFGIYVYMGAGLGCGPRDALMMGLGKRLRKLSVGTVRTLMEGAALLVGWALGSEVGLGTVMAVFGLGACIQIIFSMVKFDAKTTKHIGLEEMLRAWTE